MCGYVSKLIFDKEKNTVIRVRCNECKKETNHIILCDVDNSWDDYADPEEIFGVGGYTKYQIIRCQGCNAFSFRIDDYFSENDDSTEVIYPNRDSGIPEESFESVPQNILRIYSETIAAFNTRSYTLCAAGLRAIVEGICHDKNIDGGEITKMGKDGSTKTIFSKKLEGKIAGLCQKSYLTQQHAEILHEHRYLGNEAVHKLALPGRKELELAIEIMEHTFKQMYDLPSKAEEFLKQKQTRQKRNP